MKEEVKVGKKEEPTITNKNTAATTEHTAETSIPTHLTETTSALLVRESDKGREVEGSLLGRRSLVYSQHLSSLRSSPSARCSSLTRECREYLKKLPPRSIEAENTEEYLLSNRMLGLALFNEEDIEKYDRLARQRRQESVAAEQEISATLRQKLSQLTHTCVIDDAERPEFDDIVQDLRETIAAAYQVIYADGAKKERPDGGTSKRSVSQADKPENDCINSIAHSRRNASPVLTKGVYAR